MVFNLSVYRRNQQKSRENLRTQENRGGDRNTRYYRKQNMHDLPGKLTRKRILSNLDELILRWGEANSSCAIAASFLSFDATTIAAELQFMC